MSWQTTIIPIVRGLIFDLVPPYTYCDIRLEELICISAVLVMQEVGNFAYTVDLSAMTITPDPSDNANFVALVSLRTACLIAQGEHKDAAKTAVSVKDGPAFIDTKERAKQLGEVAEDACTNYSNAKYNYRFGDGTLGRTIVGPYNIGLSPDTGRRFN